MSIQAVNIDEDGRWPDSWGLNDATIGGTKRQWVGLVEAPEKKGVEVGEGKGASGWFPLMTPGGSEVCVGCDAW